MKQKEINLTPTEYIDKNMKNVFLETRALLEALYAARIEEIVEYCKQGVQTGHIKIGGVNVTKKEIMPEYILSEITNDPHVMDIWRCMGLIDQIKEKRELLNKIKQDVQ